MDNLKNILHDLGEGAGINETIAKYTDKIEIINQTLFISSTVAPLKNELLYQKEKIIERVNDALGEKVIKEVVIK